LHTSGVKVPTLGSPQDRVLRAFLTNKAVKEVNKSKALVLGAIAMANTSKTPEATVRSILSSFNDYVSSELFLDKVLEDTEQIMRDEYEFWRKVRPKVNISNDGKSATLSVSSLKPKSN
jgi:hypothetical protein